MDELPTILPIEAYDSSDPGDETQRNFRYQHAYGVILLAAAITNKSPYVALWCEHHEDYLAERDDGLFDAWQIKTRKPENGAWQLNTDALRDSIRRFVKLEKQFPGKIKNYYFASNAEVSKSQDEKKIAKSPSLFLAAVKNATASDEGIKLAPPFDGSLKELCDHCGCTAQEILAVLNKLDFPKGPDRDGFESAVAHIHLPQIPGCESLAPSELNGLRDELIQAIYNASSLQISDPAKHWYCLSMGKEADPRLVAKKVSVETALKIIQESRPLPFRFTPQTTRYQLSVGQERMSVLEKKFIKAGLSNDLDTMRNRSFAAERRLMEKAILYPDKIENLLDQLTGIVKGECDEAQLFAQTSEQPYGAVMLRDVITRLRKVSEQRSAVVAGEEYECLMGVSGLLTGECAIWWSEKFDLELPV